MLTRDIISRGISGYLGISQDIITSMVQEELKDIYEDSDIYVRYPGVPWGTSGYLGLAHNNSCPACPGLNRLKIKNARG